MGKVKEILILFTKNITLYQFPMGKVKEILILFTKNITLYQFPMGKVKEGDIISLTPAN